MKSKIFSGWKDVFTFTIQQAVTRKYWSITLGMAVILLVSGFGINFFSARSQQKDANISPVEKVYVIDESGIEDIKWSDSKQLDKEQFPNVVFERCEETVEDIGRKLNSNESKSVIAKISKFKEHYEVNVYIPFGSDITKDDGKNLAKAIQDIVREGLINASGVDSDKIAYVVSDISVEFCEVGENAQSGTARAISTALPMVLMLVIYLMVIIYGQSMGQIVSIEKSSKLMETLLLMTKPYGLILGKIIAMSFTAIFQIMLWIAAVVTGFVAGDVIVRNTFYADYDNRILEMLGEITSNDSIKAFSTGSIVLTLIVICLAFIFYCILAGAIASFASKADELGSVMTFYNMFIVIGFLGSYLLPAVIGQEWIKIVIRLIPVSAAFILPGEILVGTLSTGEAIAYTLVLCVWILATAVIAGNVYKNQLFYNGKSLAERLPWAKKKKDDDDEEKWQILHDEAGRPIEQSQKIGYFLVSVCPLAIFIVMQVVISFVVTNIITRIDFHGINLNQWETRDFVEYYRGIENSLNPIVMIVCHILIITVFGLWMYFIRKSTDKDNIFHVKSLLGRSLGIIIGACIVSGLALCILANGVVVIEAELIPSVVENYIEMTKNSGIGTNPLTIIAAVCMAPIGEELLCRGVCMHFSKKAFGKFWYANICQALVFGILHLNLVQGIYAFIIGLVLGVLVERYESLLPSMIVHFVVNFSSSTWFTTVFKNVESTFSVGIIMVVVAGMVTYAALRLSKDK